MFERNNDLSKVEKGTFLLKVSRNEGYKLSQKMTKNTFMALFLI